MGRTTQARRLTTALDFITAGERRLAFEPNGMPVAGRAGGDGEARTVGLQHPVHHRTPGHACRVQVEVDA